MPPAGTKAQMPVGSAAWISGERKNIMQMVDQEMEDVQYPVDHEIVWLNEHMAEIFSTDQFCFTDAFKTPGKLRGKTPRTAQRRNADEPRVPLTEIFSSTPAHPKSNGPNTSPSPYRSPSKTAETAEPVISAIPNSNIKDFTETAAHPRYPDLSQNLNSFPEYNADSGYQGTSDSGGVTKLSTVPTPQSNELLEGQQSPIDYHFRHSRTGRATTDSFHSAQENVRQCGRTVDPMDASLTPKRQVEMQVSKDSDIEELSSNMEKPLKLPQLAQPLSALSPEKELVDKQESTLQHREKDELPVKPLFIDAEQDGLSDPAAVKMEMFDNPGDIGSLSDECLQDPMPIRKSGLAFPSLPAREPLTKKSLGAGRISRASHVSTGKLRTGGSGYGTRHTGIYRTAPAALDESTASDNMDIDGPIEIDKGIGAENNASKLHSKSSTQRLHDKISMLGKSQPARTTKSIASTLVSYPDLPTVKPETGLLCQSTYNLPDIDQVYTDRESLAKPLTSPPQRVQEDQTIDIMPSDHPGNGGSSEATPHDTSRNIENSTCDAISSYEGIASSPQTSRQKSLHAATVPSVLEKSTTPSGSPERQGGPLSASKLKLQSIMRSAKSLFSSSGAPSEVARMEAPSPNENLAVRVRANTHTAGVNQERLSAQAPSHVKEGRRTRSSAEREQRRKQQEFEDCREVEQSDTPEQRNQKAAAAKRAETGGPDAYPVSAKRLPRPQKQAARELEPMAAAARPAAQHSIAQQLSKSAADRRPVKPTREPTQKPKPQPVSIRVGSVLSRQMPLATSSRPSSVQELNAPVPPPSSATRQPAIKKKPSNSSLHTAPSSASFKSSTSSQSQRKTQLASEKKRDLEGREIRRKDELKRELERKRISQQQHEEAQRHEQLGHPEAERCEHEYMTADNCKKTAQMQAIEKRRLENVRRLERQGNQQLSNEPESVGVSSRADLGSSRVISRLGSSQPYTRLISQPPPNPAKPPKRGLEDESGHRPAPRKPSSTMQPSGETKRRKTEDEQKPVPVRPTMAPPIRQSNIRREPTKPSVLSQGQITVQPGPSATKTAQTQWSTHPIDMAKYTTGKIPFAEPSSASLSYHHKTPVANSAQKVPVRLPSKYPNGESITLPEIATDSEDEDSDAEMLPVPKWAQPKELESLLRQQEGMEVDSIFGPIAPFSLEETFKSDKKIRKFRERTSSANWSGPDGLTQDEIKRDLSERQRMRLNGGWSFNGC